MQINGIGNNQIGNSYRNPNHMPNSTAGKKEDEDVNKRLEALGVKVELSFQQTGAQQQEQEIAKETVETERPQEIFSVLGWIKKIWDAGIAWLKSIWNDELAQEISDKGTDFMSESSVGEDAGLEDLEMFDADAELVDEAPLDEDTAYAAVHVKVSEEQNAPVSLQTVAQKEQSAYRMAEDMQEASGDDKFRTTGTPLHTSGMQDSYNRYGQHSKLGVEPSVNMQMRK